MFGKRADALGKFLRKGQQVCVEGGLRTNQWEDKDGNKRYTTEVRAMNLELLGKKGDNAGGGQQGGSGKGGGFEDDDLPY